MNYCAEPERELFIDRARFIGICLVIVGHCIQFNINNAYNNFFFNLIYSFHMPLFFIISGYVAQHSKNKSIKLKKRIISLLYPFILWSFLLNIIVKSNYSSFYETFRYICYPDNGYWFLWVLFYISIITDLFYSKIWTLKLVALLLALLVVIFNTPLFGFNLIKYYGIFYFVGIILCRYSLLFRLDSISICAKAVFVCAGVILSLLYMHDNNYTVLFNNASIQKIFIFLYKIITAIIISLSLIISIKLLWKNESKDIIVRIGQSYTLPLYVTNSFFVSLLNFSNQYINFCINLLIVITASALIIYFLDKVSQNSTSLLLFGR